MVGWLVGFPIATAAYHIVYLIDELHEDYTFHLKLSPLVSVIVPC